MLSIKVLVVTTTWLLHLLLVVGILTCRVQSWSFPSNNNNSNSNNNNNNFSRRQLLQKSVAAAAVVGLSPSAAHAACLQGDLRPVCIGIYKVPLDDAVLPYISTPEQLKKFAPDLTYVPPIEVPKSFESAMDILQTQRAAADNIKQIVAAGKLEEAGIQVLGVIPKVTTSCRLILSELEAEIGREGTVENMKMDMAEDQMSYVNGYWGECDITIGQGLRGDLGVSAVAQLTILSSLRDATGALDDFLVTASILKKGV